MTPEFANHDSNLSRPSHSGGLHRGLFGSVCWKEGQEATTRSSHVTRHRQSTSDPYEADALEVSLLPPTRLTNSDLPDRRFTEWAKQYGEIFSLKVGPSTAIVLTSPRLVRQLLDKKSAIYNHRPPSHVGDIIAGGDHLLLMQYSDQWRTCRKLVHQYFMEQMVVKHHVETINAEAVQMIRDMMLAPEGHMRHPDNINQSTAPAPPLSTPSTW